MSIAQHKGNPFGIKVTDSLSMLEAIKTCGIIPFFENPVMGYSIEEMTPSGSWFTEEDLGPWDWKVDVVQSGEIVYGKFLCGGKAAFATPYWYAHLRNWRLSQEKHKPTDEGRKVLRMIEKEGSCVSRQVRELLNVKKSKSDSVLASLMNGTRLIIGDIQRVYKGPNLEYKGWQTASYCTPESLFERPAEDFGPWHIGGSTLKCDCSPEESYSKLRNHIRGLFPEATEKQLDKII
ncbi:MAG: hypothetical protein IKW99_01050 [Bacteroidales bacterium]|nr:hypothetical protein [Bacteroidales bacterium]